MAREDDFLTILRLLNEAEIDYVVIGGVAMAIHGSSKDTFDLDVIYRRTREQATRIAEALSALHPRPRGLPPELPFRWDGLSFLNNTIGTYETDAGDLDFLAEAEGSGGYDNISRNAHVFDFGDLSVRVASLQDLLNMKRAAGRSKDDVHISELEDWLAQESEQS